MSKIETLVKIAILKVNHFSVSFSILSYQTYCIQEIALKTEIPGTDLTSMHIKSNI
jgi:hypothetical protein